MRTSFGGGGNLAEAFGALFGRRIRRRIFARAFDKEVHRLHHKKEDGCGNDEERDNGVEEMSVLDLASVDRIHKPAEVRHSRDPRDKRRHDVEDERVDDGTKGCADDDTDREGDDVAAKQELLEFF